MVLFFSESLVSVDLRVKKRFQKKLAKFKEREEKERCVYWKALGKRLQATFKKKQTKKTNPKTTEPFSAANGF